MAGIVTVPAVFAPEHVPLGILGRQAQIEQLLLGLAPSARGARPVHTWVHGRTGTGKSTSVRAALARHSAAHGVRCICVNCYRNRTAYAVLDCLLTEMRVLLAETPTVAYKIRRLTEALAGKPLAVALDEVDRMERAEREDILHLLSEVPGVGLLCVSEDRSACASLPERTMNRLSPVFVEMGPYGTDTLLTILLDRADAGLVPGSWNQGLLEKIAGMCGGDARVAIQTLRAAAHLADCEASGYIQEKHVQDGFARSQDIRREYRLKRLTVHHRLIFDIVREGGTVVAHKVFLEYRERCAQQGLQPIANRTFYRYVEVLRQMRLIRGERARAFAGTARLEAVE